jgi:ParB-like nuclease domain
MDDRHPTTEGAEESTSLAGRVGDLVGGVVGVGSDVVGGAVDAARTAAHRWDERPGARVRRLRRLARQPLPYLYDLHPDARRANPRELGVKTIDVDLIAGTAVGGATQRGSDFLPLKPFRSLNWQGRWQRIRAAIDRLTVLPPIDVVGYAGRYWVLDGHNRVAAALYAGQVQIDAAVVELVPPGGVPSEQSGDLAAVLTESRALRNAGEGRAGGHFHDAPFDRESET